MWLNVSVASTEQFFSTVDRQLLDYVDVFAATVVTLAWVTFGVLVSQLRALCFHHAWAGVVFRGDQLNVMLLTGILRLHR